MKKIRFLFVTILLLGISVSKIEAQNYFGDYTGEWSDVKDHLYTFKLHLEKDNSYIIWSPINPPAVPATATATEFITITPGSTSRTLTLKGYKKEDPYNITGLEEYRLKLSEDDKVLYGITKNNGNWKGTIYCMKTILLTDESKIGQKELALKERELVLKEKELELKEKELKEKIAKMSAPSSKADSSTKLSIQQPTKNSSDNFVGNWKNCNNRHSYDCIITKQGDVYNFHLTGENRDFVLEKKSELLITGASGLLTIRYDESTKHLFLTAAGDEDGNAELCKSK